LDGKQCYRYCQLATIMTLFGLLFWFFFHHVDKLANTVTWYLK